MHDREWLNTRLSHTVQVGDSLFLTAKDLNAPAAKRAALLDFAECGYGYTVTKRMWLKHDWLELDLKMDDHFFKK